MLWILTRQLALVINVLASKTVPTIIVQWQRLMRSRSSRSIYLRMKGQSSQLTYLDHYHLFFTTRTRASRRGFGAMRSSKRIRPAACLWSRLIKRLSAAEPDAARCMARIFPAKRTAKTENHDSVAEICRSWSDLAQSDPWRATPEPEAGEVNKVGCKHVYDNLSSLSSGRAYGRTKSGHCSDTSASPSKPHARQTLQVSV